MKRPPTDFELLRAIYERHGDEFRHSADSRATKVFVPLNVPEVAGKLGVDPNSVVGRLYHHLDPIYAQEPDPTVGRTARKSFFSLRVGNEANCVNFPLLEAVLAGLWQQRDRDLFAVVTAIVSLVVASTSLGVAIVSAAT